MQNFIYYSVITTVMAGEYSPQIEELLRFLEQASSEGRLGRAKLEVRDGVYHKVLGIQVEQKGIYRFTLTGKMVGPISTVDRMVGISEDDPVSQVLEKRLLNNGGLPTEHFVDPPPIKPGEPPQGIVGMYADISHNESRTVLGNTQHRYQIGVGYWCNLRQGKVYKGQQVRKAKLSFVY